MEYLSKKLLLIYDSDVQIRINYKKIIITCERENERPNIMGHVKYSLPCVSHSSQVCITQMAFLYRKDLEGINPIHSFVKHIYLSNLTLCSSLHLKPCRTLKVTYSILNHSEKPICNQCNSLSSGVTSLGYTYQSPSPCVLYQL